EQRSNQQVPYLNINKLKLLAELYEKVNKERAKEEQLEELTTFISLIKNKGLTKEKWPTLQCHVPQAIEIFQQYETIKQHHYDVLLVDYDDMLTIALQAFEQDSSILNIFQHQYHYVLTDESQDTSLVQHHIIALIAKQHQQLFVVADDDQAIYSWRGAEVTYLLKFKEQYPKAEILFLQQNYRSTKKIVEAANKIIHQNKSRYSK